MSIDCRINVSRLVAILFVLVSRPVSGKEIAGGNGIKPSFTSFARDSKWACCL